MAQALKDLISGSASGQKEKEQPPPTETTLPTTQKAAVRDGQTAPIKEIAVPELKAGQILVKINWTGLCHSDIGFLRDYWPEFDSGALVRDKANGVCGHEGAGAVAAVAPDVEAAQLWRVGERAGIKWCASVCGRCEFCTNGADELHCPAQLNSGLTTPGTFQRYVATDARYATRLPDAVADEEAGPLMCGGVTAYVACKRSGLGVQYARVMGMRSIAVDVGPEKEELCKKLGAEAYIDASKCEDLAAEVTKITTYGVIAMRKLNIVGSVTGTLKEVEEMLDFTARGLVHPILTKGKLSELDKYIDLVIAGKLQGRAVLKVED
ncbi:hypothetical protein SLS58_001450 [Diplodia intermedia]|uniref:alcohol dehydrogenase n=1 Tax=Diplodia intermedia TaxID=856260 RepID=A0ABR3U2A0_9PEZI